MSAYHRSTRPEGLPSARGQHLVPPGPYSQAGSPYSYLAPSPVRDPYCDSGPAETGLSYSYYPASSPASYPANPPPFQTMRAARSVNPGNHHPPVPQRENISRRTDHDAPRKQSDSKSTSEAVQYGWEDFKSNYKPGLCVIYQVKPYLKRDGETNDYNVNNRTTYAVVEKRKHNETFRCKLGEMIVRLHEDQDVEAVEKVKRDGRNDEKWARLIKTKVFDDKEVGFVEKHGCTVNIWNRFLAYDKARRLAESQERQVPRKLIKEHGEDAGLFEDDDFDR